MLDDRERLNQDFARVELERRHPHLRIDRAKLGTPVMAAVFGKMDRNRLVGEPLKVERDPRAISRRRAEIRIELHRVSPTMRASACARARRPWRKLFRRATAR